MNKEIEAKVEYQNVIGEANPGSYRPIRFSRIKYKASQETHIDIRQYQRGYDGDGEEQFYPTKTGFRFLENEFNRVIKAYALLPKTYVHMDIIKKCFPLLEKGEFDSAVLKAFKLIETNIRRKIKAKPEEIGIRLIRKAFDPNSGTLTNYELPAAEREAFAHYIAGAFGYYKNPCSHRDIELNFISTFERIVVASNLLKIIDESKVNTL
jgi:uncharacterized protein (TIGR02391 family)